MSMMRIAKKVTATVATLIMIMTNGAHHVFSSDVINILYSTIESLLVCAPDVYIHHVIMYVYIYIYISCSHVCVYIYTHLVNDCVHNDSM